MKRLVLALAVLATTAYLTEKFPTVTPICSSSRSNMNFEELEE